MTTRPGRPTLSLRSRFIRTLACSCLLLARPAGARQDTPPADAAAATTAATPGEVKLGVERFGVGDSARAGDWGGFRVKVFDTAPKQRDVLVRVAGQDSDGDSAEYDRTITTNPGVWQGVWLYLRLPFNFQPSSTWFISAYEAVDDPAAPTGYRPGRMLARAPFQPASNASIIDPGISLIGVVGNARYGLEKYVVPANPRELWAADRHELEAPVSSITPADMPDRWIGLAPFESLIWGNAEPAELRGERSRAVRDWVRRGGHLIIILPAVGQNWSNPQSNDLHDILPIVSIARREGVDLEPLRPLLTSKKSAELPKNAVLTTFTPLPDADAADAIPILSAPDGTCVVVRRLVGAGVVTLVGLDLNRPEFAQGKALEADVFWHRVLGKRGLFPREGAQQKPGWAGMLNRSPFDLDPDIPGAIQKTGRSAQGVLLALVVFAAYWLLAGPLGFTLIKRRGWTKHAWVGFLAAAGVFTAIAWGGAHALRPSKVQASHVTFLDHVYGQDVQRARGWFGLLIPRYGNADITVGDPEEGDAAGGAGHTWNTVAPWDQPGGGKGAVMFPDTRGYSIDARGPDRLVVPARATVKEFQADWAGSPRWEMPHPVIGPEGTTTIQRLAPATAGAPARLRGVLVHKLPGELHDVRVIFVDAQTSLVAGGTDLPVAGQFAAISLWKPGEDLDLSLVFGTKSDKSLLAGLTDLTGRVLPDSAIQNALGTPDADRRLDRLLALALYSQLAPVSAMPTRQNPLPAARRSLAHTWDLGRWFTQPCVIILGFLSDPADSSHEAESPIPLRADGKAVPTSGLTMIRWVYPLPPRPPAFPAPAETSDGSSQPG